jgi:ATP-dependent Clp protease ATP-binding subunit ClpC
MYERFTDRSRKVMQLANQEAQRFNHEYIGTEHILLGLVKEGSGVAANVLKNLDIDLRKVRQEVEKIVQHGPGGEEIHMGRLPHTPRSKKVIEYAIEEARTLHHNYIGTEHLLLGLLREEEGVAAQVLMNLGVKLDKVRAEVLNILGQIPPTGTPTTEPYVVADKTPGVIPLPPQRVTDEQIQLIRERIRHLNEWKETLVAGQEFALAAKCRDEVEALNCLLAWYDWWRGQQR